MHYKLGHNGLLSHQIMLLIAHIRPNYYFADLFLG